MANTVNWFYRFCKQLQIKDSVTYETRKQHVIRHLLSEYDRPLNQLKFKLAQIYSICFPSELFDDLEWSRHLQSLASEANRQLTKGFVCDNCDFRFLKKTNFTSAIHKNKCRVTQKYYQCDNCNKRFPTKEKFNVHNMHFHKKIRPFACHLCDKRFIHKHDVTTHHWSVHSRWHPFVCDKCDHGFVFKESLLRHILFKVHSKWHPFVCDKCGKGFINKTRLQKHFYLCLKKEWTADSDILWQSLHNFCKLLGKCICIADLLLFLQQLAL